MGLFGVDPLSSLSGATTVLESLDLIVPLEEDYNVLVSTLHNLMALYKRHRSCTPRDLLLLEQHWIGIGKAADKPIYGGDWANICVDCVGVPLSKARLHVLFEKHCVTLGVDHNEGLRLGPGLVRLMELVRSEVSASKSTVDPCSDVWKCIETSARIEKENTGSSENTDSSSSNRLVTRGGDIMTADSFLKFLRDEQRESSACISEVYELFSRLNSQTWQASSSNGKEPIANGRDNNSTGQVDHISKSLFASYLLSDANDIFDPKAGAADSNDMAKPLNQYWINTSHKSYKNMGHIDEMAGAQPYTRALQRGCRCLELDLWDGTDKHSNSVIVRDRESPSHSGVPVQDVLFAIRSFLKSVPSSYPIILSIENNCALPYQEKLFLQLNAILGDEGMLYRPPGSLEELGALPSPEALRGKVVIKSKRPLPDGQSSAVVNDDNDDNIDLGLEMPGRSTLEEDDDDSDEDKRGIVVGFDQAGMVLSNDEAVVKRTPHELFDIANQHAIESKASAESAEKKAFDLQVHSNDAEKHADMLSREVGIARELFEQEREALVCGSPQSPSAPAVLSSPLSGVTDNMDSMKIDGDGGDGDDWLKSIRLGRDISKLGEQIGESIGLGPVVSADECDDSYVCSSPRSNNPAKSTKELDEIVTPAQTRMSDGGKSLFLALSGEDGGLEVQDYLNESILQAESVFVEADEKAAKAANAATIALANFQAKAEALDEAESQLYDNVQSNRDLLIAADRAATEARANREHADTAQQRAETVRQLHANCKGQTKSAETVAGTAQTEAEISAQRAEDAEKRAARAHTAAKRDRTMADAETKKEEDLGKEVMDYRAKYDEASINYKNAKERLESTTARLSQIEKDIEFIESSSAFKSEYGKATEEHPEDEEIVVPPGSILAQHKTKIVEMKACLNQVKDSASVKASEDKLRKRSKHMLEEVQEKVKAQTKIAASARRQADHSTSLAEQLAEYAEEEREAASMRKIALNKASACVMKSTTHGSSVESQLAEAERAAEEAVKKADESRAMADKLAKQTKETKDTSELEARVRALKVEKEKAMLELEAARAVQQEAEDEALESKKRLTSNQELLDKAKKDSAEAVDREAKDKQLRVNALLAHCKAVEMKRLAEEAKGEASQAVVHAAARAAALRHAKHYMDKRICVKPIYPPLQQITLIHSHKFRYWAKSLTLPFWFAHSISESAMFDMASRGGLEIKQWNEFNRKYLTRIFPTKQRNVSSLPYLNPMVPWALGCQMVSISSQERNDSTLLNDGRFRENGSCGYVLKTLKADDSSPRDLDDSCPEDEIRTGDFVREIKIQVLSGSNIPKPVGVAPGSTSICVFVSLFDGETNPKKMPTTHVTHSVGGNVFNPVWNEDKGAKFETANSNVAMLLFQVWNSSDDNAQDSLIGAAAVPLSGLREGYRSVQLFDLDHTRRGAYGCASLLVHVHSRYLLSRTEV